MTIDDDNFGFRFRDWDIYQDARKFRNEINELLKGYPKEENTPWLSNQKSFKFDSS